MEEEVVIVSREASLLLQEEVWWADVSARGVVAPVQAAEATQQTFHDEKLVPLKLLKDQAQRRALVCEMYIALLREADAKNWADAELVPEALARAAHLKATCRAAVMEDWLGAREVAPGQDQQVDALVTEEMDLWPQLLRVGESRPAALARLQFVLSLAQEQFTVNEREHEKLGMAFGNENERLNREKALRIQSYQQELQRFDMSLLGRAKIGDAAGVISLMDVACNSLFGKSDKERLFCTELIGPLKLGAVHMAAHYGRGDVLRVLVRKVPGCARLLDGAGFSPLFHALASRSVRHLDTVRVLLAADPLAGMQYCQSMTPLLWCARCANVEATGLILQAAPHLVNEQEPQTLRSPLHIACHRGAVRVVSQLLAAGAATHVQDANHNTPLQVALLTTSPSAASLRTIVHLLHTYASPPLTAEQCAEHRRKFRDNPEKLVLLEITLQLYSLGGQRAH